MAGEEQVFYEGDKVTITRTRAVLRGTTYPMANITSVRLWADLIHAARQLGVSVASLVGEPAAEPWADEALGMLRGLPASTRDTVLGMLRGAAASPTLAKPEATRTPRRRQRRR